MDDKVTRKQYSNYIRNHTRNTKKGECCICGYNQNTQQHHVTPVLELSIIAFENQLSQKEVNDMYCETVFLCKEHHKRYHAIADYNYSSKVLDIDEFNSYMTMLRKYDDTNVPEYLDEWYKSRINEYIKSTVDNFLDNSDFNFGELDDYMTQLAETEIEIEEGEKNVEL